MNAIARLKDQVTARPNDPAGLGWPPTLPIEIAMKTASVKEICQGYGLDKADWEQLQANPQFVATVAEYIEMLKKEGMSFKLKSRLQAEELLKTSWKIIHDRTGDVPPQVKADLIKSTMRWAGYEIKEAAAGNQANNLQININL